MNGFTKTMDKMKPKFEKIASNPYVSAVRDGLLPRCQSFCFRVCLH